MRILLVNPPSPERLRVSRGLMGGFGMAVNENLVYPPLNLAYAAALLRQKGHEVEILDAEALDLDRAETLRRGTARARDLVGVDSSTTTIEADLGVATELAGALRVCSFAMGAQVANTPDAVLGQSGVDFVIRGEVAATTLALVEALAEQGSAAGVEGLSFRGPEGIVHNPPRAKIADLDALPFPARDLLPNERYRIPDMRGPMTTVQSSRGCPIGCTYCGYALSQGTRYRARSAENVLAELVEIRRRFDIRNVVFRDPLFSANRRRVRDLCAGIQREGLDLEWQCETAIKCLDEELLGDMRRAGCVSVSVGVETADPELGSRYSNAKIRTAEHALRVVSAARRLGIRTRAFFMLGFPEETREQMRRTVELAVRLDPDAAQFTAVTPYPGTPMWVEHQKGRPETYARYDGHTPTGVNTVLAPDELAAEIKRAYRRFYLRPGRIARQLASPRRLLGRIRHYLAMHE
ncbi:MAG: radical SAM protein [Planctomycetes bacterium]|nr:radical SAM protein [Planctomycetota bacterium]